MDDDIDVEFDALGDATALALSEPLPELVILFETFDDEDGCTEIDAESTRDCDAAALADEDGCTELDAESERDCVELLDTLAEGEREAEVTLVQTHVVGTISRPVTALQSRPPAAE